MQTALIIIASLVLVFFFLVWRARKMMKDIPAVTDHRNIITLTDRNFSEQTKNRIVIVDFWAAWCGPCKMMAPVLNELAEEVNGSTLVGKVNVDQYSSLARKYGVRSIPTLVLLKNGKEIDRLVGIKTRDFILKQLEKYNSN